MGIFDTFKRSWEITKQSFKVIKSDKEILLFPVLASVFSVILFVLMAVPFAMAEVMQALGLDKLGELAYYILVFVFYVGVSFIATFFNVGVVYCAKKRFEGGDPTFSEGMKEAAKRIANIFLWSLVSATVGLILRILEDSVEKSRNDAARIIGSIVVGLLGAAWSVASIFVVPALVFDNVGPFDAIKKSVEAVKKTWGESMVRHYGLGLAQFALAVVGGIVLLVPGILLISVSGIAALALIGLFVVYLVVLSLLFATANTIFNTALYMYARHEKTPSAYSHETMQHAFAKH